VLDREERCSGYCEEGKNIVYYEISGDGEDVLRIASG
jgi:hypothetical protein